jgi:hypothetical protein
MARKQETPGDLFKYLETNEIGQEVAIYYLEYATFKETGGFIREAKEIYQLGIKRNAQPLEKLQRRYEKFKLRTADMPLEPEVKPVSILTDQVAPGPTNSGQKEKVRVFQDDTVESIVKPLLIKDQQKRPVKKMKKDKKTIKTPKRDSQSTIYLI